MAQICPKDCPKRGKPGCHTEKCSTWKTHIAHQKEVYKRREELARLRQRPYESH